MFAENKLTFDKIFMTFSRTKYGSNKRVMIVGLFYIDIFHVLYYKLNVYFSP